MRRQLVPALLMTVVLSVMTGLLYPLAVTAVAQVTMKHRANGSLVTRDGHAVGRGARRTEERTRHPVVTEVDHDDAGEAGQLGGEPAQPLKCTHTSHCECWCDRSSSPCAEYTAAQAISAQAATRATMRLRRAPVLKLGNSV